MKLSFIDLYNTSLIKPLYVDLSSVSNKKKYSNKQFIIKIITMFKKVAYKSCHKTKRMVVTTATQM